MDKNSETVAKSRYFKDDESSWEDVSQRIIREVSKLDQNKIFVKNCYDSLNNMDFIPGGRIIRNIGRVKGSMMNCNVIPIGDSIEEIGTCFKDSLIIWSFGGGIGINFSTLRPNGAPMLTKGGTSSGLVSFLKAIDSLASTIETGGQRRAAGMAICDISHPEIMDFIDVKLQDGLISYFNLSVAVNDQFLEAVEKDEKWNLTFGGRIYKTVDANMLWDKILNNMIKSAEPGLINWGNLTKNNSFYFSPIVSTNPCHTGDTMVAVADGRKKVRFDQLVKESKDVPVFSFNDKTKKVEIKMMRNIRKTGFKKKIIKVYLDDGSFFRCNETHKVTMFNTDVKQAKDLIPGDRLHHMVKYTCSLEGVIGKENTKNRQDYIWINNGFSKGIAKAEHRIVAEFKVGRKLNKNEVVHHENYNYQDNSIDNLVVMTKKEHDKLHSKDKIGEKNPVHRYPEKNIFNNPDFQKWVRENYHIGKKRSKETCRKIREAKIKSFRDNPELKDKISISTKEAMNRPEIREKFEAAIRNRAIKRLQVCKSKTDLNCFLKNNIVIVEKRCEYCENIFVVPFGRREQCFCSHNCASKSERIRKLNSKGLKRYHSKIDLNFKVVKIEEDGFEDVYNGTVDDNHNFYVYVGETKCENKLKLNFMNSRNCGEIPLPNWGSCCLGSINLKNMLQGTQTNWKKLDDTIKTGVRFLDNIIDINYYPVNELAVESTRSRRIGLGIMGLADFLLAKKIRYGSERCLVEIDKLFKFIRDKAYEASIELATIKSSFPMFDKVAFGKASFIRKLPAKIRMAIKEKGIRNCSILTCAPTGTTSLIPNVSSGIEPIPFKAYRRCDRINERIYIHPEYEKCLLNGLDNEYLVDTGDLKPEDHFEVQAVIQKYIDSSISKTINLPKDTTPKQLNKLLLEYIHDLKGVTVYRDGCREGQILTRISKEEALTYLKDRNSTNELSEEDVKCSKGTCEI